jgi:hypothetical protein
MLGWDAQFRPVQGGEETQAGPQLSEPTGSAPEFPAKGFGSLNEARTCSDFVRWKNFEHRERDSINKSHPGRIDRQPLAA